jgi:hypothetical protein
MSYLSEAFPYLQQVSRCSGQAEPHGSHLTHEVRFRNVVARPERLSVGLDIFERAGRHSVAQHIHVLTQAQLRLPGFYPRSGQVALGQVFSEYLPFHRLLHTHHHLSSGAGTIGRTVADSPSGLSLASSQ